MSEQREEYELGEDVTALAKSKGAKQMGGRRILSISPKLFVAFFKAREDRHRTYTVNKALPDDAKIVDGRIAWNKGGIIEILLESAEWQDETVGATEHLPPPEVTAHYLERPHRLPGQRVSTCRKASCPMCGASVDPQDATSGDGQP